MIIHSRMSKRLHFSTNFILSFSLLIHSVWQIEGKDTFEVKLTEESKNKQTTNLSCHVCHSEMNDTCFNFTESGEGFPGFPRVCKGDQLMCVVKKFAFTSTDGNGAISAMKTFSVKRNCTKKCEDGCVVMGERTRLYVCSQCCSTPLCNVGGGSGSVHYRRMKNAFPYLVSSVAYNFFAGISHNVWPILFCFYLMSPRSLQLII